MTLVQVHRKNQELTGKALSANTIASFLAAQRVRSVPDLSIDRCMSPALLLFLNRDRAMRYWRDNGWIRSSNDEFYLTEAGLEEIQLRESGEARNVDGRKKPGNVDPTLVAAALRFIETGRRITPLATLRCCRKRLMYKDRP
ncbi:MAG: hypothetical protein U5O39_10055 [Gammaproteobacteria bacterium]|nr:hypothetical protein [Gammaproteobacteria bacterium]